MKIDLKLDGTDYSVNAGISILQLLKDKEAYKIPLTLAAWVNNCAVSLNYLLAQNHETIELITADMAVGRAIHRQSVAFLLNRVIFDLFRNSRIVLGAALGNSYYYDFYTDIPVNEELLKEIALQMHLLIEKNEIFENFTLSKEEAIDYFRKRGFYNKLKLVEQLDRKYISIYSCGPYKDIDLGTLAPHAGYIGNFWLKRYSRGFILYYGPESEKEHYLVQLGRRAKLFAAFIESKRWGQIIEVNNVHRLNEVILSQRIQDVVNICEGLHEKKIGQIADQILLGKNKQKIRLILISGPSSSGKTTFTQRLAIHLRINGIKPMSISLDNYYIDRDKTPLDENGNYDFENIAALDLPLLNEHLQDLINGNEVEMPLYDFETGKRRSKTKVLRIDEYQPLILEGIHALNPVLTSSISDSFKFKIYVSALTPLAIDDYNRISSSDNRLLRRMVRDFHFRGYRAEDTIDRWPLVRAGEEKWVFPFQEEADVLFNSAHHFELSLLKMEAEQLLKKIDTSLPAHRVAVRLLSFLSIFQPIAPEYIPATSILREFVGGSCFNY